MRTSTEFSIDSGVGRLTMARPEVRNAITDLSMIDEIISAVAEAESDPATTVLVITGQGTAFSAGGNIKDMVEKKGMFAGDAESIAESYRQGIQRLTSTIAATDLVLIAAVNGPAVGAGFDLALGCDLRLAATKATFTHTFVDLGILPGDGGAWLLTRVLGWQRAADLAFTGRTLDSTEALDLGLVLSIHPPEDLLVASMELAMTIAAKPAHSVRLTKRLMRHARSLELGPFLDMTAAYQAIAHTTDAHRRAVTEFAERLWKPTT